VVVVLVDLLLDGRKDFLMPALLDSLVGYCRGNFLVDGGVMVTGLGKEVVNGSFCFIHFDVLIEVE
jgi:hypothetical protein